jgi:DNA-binding CsgD family transcriptional regulator
VAGRVGGGNTLSYGVREARENRQVRQNGDGLSVGVRLMLHEAAERVANIGSWQWRFGEDEQVWSENLYRLFGVQPGQVSPTRQFVLALTHPDDRERLARYLEGTDRNHGARTVEFRVVHPGRGIRYMRSTLAPLEAGIQASTQLYGTVQDLTDEHLAGREIAAHVALSRSLTEWVSIEASAQHLLRDLAEAMEFAFAALWIPDGDVLAARVVWQDASLAHLPDFEAATLALRATRGIKLPGLVWERQASINIADVSTEIDYRRRMAARSAGLHGGAGFPAVHAGEVLAVLEFYYREESRPTDRLLQTMNAMGYELGEFLSRRRGQLHPQCLTPRELEVLQLASGGRTAAQIAEQLAIGTATVRTHLEHAYRKLGAADRAAAVAIAIRLGLIE